MMTKNTEETANHSILENLKLIEARRALLTLSAVVFTPLAGLAVVLGSSVIPHFTKDIRWARIYVEAADQVKTFSIGRHDVELLIGTYGETTAEQFREVEIELASNGQPMPTLRYAYYTGPLSDPSPGVYRRKDVDGDRTKNFVLRLGSGESNYKYYYISSRDGKGYQTDKQLQRSQPWFDESN
ncbi:MAG: hypothetical protein ABG776_21500 [Cyanobacteria bacterium J06555_13]